MSQPDFTADARRLVVKWVSDYGMAWKAAHLFMSTERDIAAALEAAYERGVRKAIETCSRQGIMFADEAQEYESLIQEILSK